MHTIRVAHSPDSDDAFMYYGLACGAVEPVGIRFEQALSDIESANAAAQEGRFDLTAISAAAYPSLAERYLLLDSGASFGDGYGPCVVVPAGSAVRRLEDLAGKRIATPGRRTSAALALALRLPDHVAVPMDFKAVGPASLRGEVEAGVVIHEGQLTWRDEGLHALVDLGVWWGEQTGGLPLPLGGNVVRRNLGDAMIRRLARLLRQAVEYALANREAALDHSLRYARGLDRATADRFVGMYVNQRTVDYGERGRQAVRLFLERAHQAGLIPRVPRLDFVAG